MRSLLSISFVFLTTVHGQTDGNPHPDPDGDAHGDVVEDNPQGSPDTDPKSDSNPQHTALSFVSIVMV